MSTPAEVAATLEAAARAVLAGDAGAAERAAYATVVSADPEMPRRVQRVMVDLLAGGVTATWQRGWQPLDLHELTRRELTAEHVGVLGYVLAHAMRPFPVGAVAPAWSEQLGQVGAPASWPAATSALEAWQLAGRTDAVWAVTLAVELHSLLLGLPRVERLLALPGTYVDGSSRTAGVLDRKVLAKVRALLAKAESTQYDEEAEALSAKAQELMTRYSLDRLQVEATGPAELDAVGRRIWLETPYGQAKALLVAAVGEANRCAVVWTEQLGFVTVIGDEREVATVELLVTSLLVQASRAMLHGPRPGGAQKRAYRQSFLVAYAQRVGERLQEASRHVTEEIGGAALVPLLAAHDERVQRAQEQLFPTTRSRSVSVRSTHGFAAGRAAADHAVLPGHPQLRDTRP